MFVRNWMCISPAGSLQGVCLWATVAVFACWVVSSGLLLSYCGCMLGCFLDFLSDRTIANFFLPCWPDHRRCRAAVCANFQIQINHFKLKIRGAGEGDGDGDGRWEWEWVGG